MQTQKTSSVVTSKNKEVVPTHRYYCDACTGIAFYFTDGVTIRMPDTCQTCGAPIAHPVKPENFVKIA